MSLLSTIEGVVGDRAEDWLSGTLDRAEGLAADHIVGPVQSALVAKAFTMIREHEGELARLGGGGLVSLLTRAGFSKVDDAKLTYLRSGTATVAELIKASHRSTAEVAAATQKRVEDWKKVEQLLEEIGSVALRLIPFLIMAA